MKENRIFNVVQSEPYAVSLLKDGTNNEMAKLHVPMSADIMEVAEFSNDVMNAYVKLFVKIKKRISEQQNQDQNQFYP